MSSMASIIPDELFDASKKAAVIDFLANAPAEAKLKQKALLDWARWVGVRIQARDYQKLAASAIDR